VNVPAVAYTSIMGMAWSFLRLREQARAAGGCGCVHAHQHLAAHRG
jgi:hypothetical protein